MVMAMGRERNVKLVHYALSVTLLLEIGNLV